MLYVKTHSITILIKYIFKNYFLKPQLQKLWSFIDKENVLNLKRIKCWFLIFFLMRSRLYFFQSLYIYVVHLLEKNFRIWWTVIQIYHNT
jgi:hypothetical protein